MRNIIAYLSKVTQMLPVIEYSSIILHLEQDTGFEPAPSAWKAEMLAANTNPAYKRSHYCNSEKKNKKLSKRLLLLCRHCCLSSPVGFHHIFSSNFLLRFIIAWKL